MRKCVTMRHRLQMPAAFANLIGIAAMAEDMFTVYEVLRGAEYGPLGHSHHGLGLGSGRVCSHFLWILWAFGLHRLCLRLL